MTFSGKVAIITGSGSGMGRAIALRFTQEGCSVLIVDRAKDRLDRVEKEIKELGGTVVSRIVDISHEEEVRSFVQEAVRRFGKLDIMVCNAGVRSTVPFFEIDDAEWYRVLDVNLKGTFYCFREAMRQMIKQRFGRIIAISSSAGIVGGTMVNAPYSASKAGIICLTKVAAKVMAPYGVTVNSVAPGTTDTPFIEDYDQKTRDMLQGLIPLGRLGTAEDVAGTVLFLASDDASWITGTTLNVSGGQVIG